MNPWESIKLSDYEGHMSLETVKQLQAMDRIMGDQFGAYPVTTAMVLGVAGGNGLEHIDKDKFSTVYGIDINSDYLKTVEERYKDLGGILQCIRIDLTNEPDKLPQAQLVIANLLIEYIGYEAFCKAVLRTGAEYVSAVIQINTDTISWVSESPYIHAFDGLDEVHHQMEEEELINAMKGIGYDHILRSSETMPNAKALVRLDFRRVT